MADHTDDFNRADSSTVGGSWVEQESNAWALSISTDRLSAGGAGLRGFMYYNQTFTADQYSKVRFKTGDDGWKAGPAVRPSGTVTNFSGYVVIFSASAAEVRKYVAQSIAAVDYTVLDSVAVTLAGDDIVELRVVGSTITVKRNDVDILTVTDGDVASGRPGFAKSDPSNTIPQNWWDDWAGGDITPPSGARSTFRRDRLRRVILARH